MPWVGENHHKRGREGKGRAMEFHLSSSDTMEFHLHKRATLTALPSVPRKEPRVEAGQSSC